MERAEKLNLQKIATRIRLGIIEGTFHAKSGHPGGSLSIADTLAYLYWKEMNVDPANPKMEGRDRLVLSKGHTAPALYAALAERGYFPVEELATLRHIGSRLQGHPNMNDTPGVEMSTGSLGQGISAACGMALAAKLKNEDSRVYTILGDGEIEEGQVWEAAMFAAHYKLDNLVAVIDNNNLQIDGPITEVMSSYPITDKFVPRSAGMSSQSTPMILTRSRPLSRQRVRSRANRPPLSRNPSRARAFPSWKIRSPGMAPPPMLNSMSRQRLS